ncbi:hypothetical protein BGX31_005333 [Mortierella sp. GBA43]|nr:hypothetical protein BGX31_005333 [Mortierella sp. GBA43]
MDGNSNNSTSTDSNNVSIRAFTSSLLFNAAIGIGVFVGFCIVRHWSKKIFIRTNELPPGAFSWITASFKVKDTELLEKVGLDAYMFLRFLRMSAFLFGACTLLAIPILLPLNMVDGINHGGLASMNIVATMVLLWREMREFTRRRHAYLRSRKHRKTPQSSTILVTAIPKGLNTEEALYNIFNRFPGGVSKIWLNRQPTNIVKLVKERDEVVQQLEMAEYRYIRSAYQKSKKDPEIKEPQRPIGRISNIPCKGDKVDLIEHYTDRLCQLNELIETAQTSGSVQFLNSAFIQFRSQFGAHSAVQTVVHPTPFNMAPMFAEISPLDVVWDNMHLDTLARKARHMVILVISTVMIMLWTIPTVVVSSLASISDIVNTFKFLSFLEGLPKEVLGIIQGVLPPLLLAGLMALLPVLLTIMATYEGHVRQSSITLSIMSKYFFFLVTNVLLISTLSGGILKTIEQIRAEGFKFDLVIGRFSEKLPQSSTFFITYVLLRGFTGPAIELMQIAPLLLNFLFTQLLAKSPHQIWNVQGRLESVNYGILFPPQTLIFCIGIVYSTIAPLILPFVTFYFTMHYFVYRHQFLYVYLQPVETGGLAFPRAAKQVYTGMFISQITLFGLFLMKQAAVTSTTVPQLVLMVLLIAITSLSLKNMNEAFDPLVTFLPVALFSKEVRVDEHGVVTDGNEKMTMARTVDEEYGGNRNGEGERARMAAAVHHVESESENENENDNGESRFLDAKENLALDHHARTLTATSTNSTKNDNHLDSGLYEADPGVIPIPGQDHQVSAPQTARVTFLERPFRHRRPSYHQDAASITSHHDVTTPGSRDSPRSTKSASYYEAASARSRPVSYQDRPVSYNSSRPVSYSDSRPVSYRDSRPVSYRDSRPISYKDSGPGSLRGSRPVSYQDSRPVSSIYSDEEEEEEEREEPTPENRELERLQDQAYCHPAIYDVQKPVWLPMDERGLALEEINRLRSRGIIVATDGAVLDSKTSKAKVQGIIYAPGEEARYRLERGE